MKGRIIGIKIGSTFVPCETSCNFTANSETIPTSNSANGNFKTSIAGYRSWSVTVNGNLIISNNEAGAIKLVEAIKNGSNLSLIMTFIKSSMGTFKIEGNVRPTSVSIDAPSVGFATWNGTFEGNGEYTITY